MWKEKVKRSEEQREKDIRSKENQHSLLDALQTQNTQLKKEITYIRKEKNLPETKVNDTGQLEVIEDNEPSQDDIIKLESARKYLELKIKDQEKAHRKDIKTWKDNI